MASVWIRRDTRRKANPFVVGWRPGGRDTPARHGGSFATERLARVRAGAIEVELAALREPQLVLVTAERRNTVSEEGTAWLASRIDIADATRTRHVSELARIAGHPLGRKRVDEVTPADVAGWVIDLAPRYARDSLKKTKQTLAMVLDHAGVRPNPARDLSVKLPRKDRVAMTPPGADAIEAMLASPKFPDKHAEALLFLDWSGARVGAIDNCTVGDYDPPRNRVRVPNKGGGWYWVTDLPSWLTAVWDARLPHPKFRDDTAPLFHESASTTLRTAMAKACKDAGVDLFSPHDLRHRRISLLHLGGMPWARIAERVGQSDLSTTADTYTHVLVDEREVDHAAQLAVAA